MRKILPVLGLPVLGVVPLMSGIAMAAQPLIDQQMDGERRPAPLMLADLRCPASPLSPSVLAPVRRHRPTPRPRLNFHIC